MSQFKRPNDILASSGGFDQRSMTISVSSRILEIAEGLPTIQPELSILLSARPSCGNLESIYSKRPWRSSPEQWYICGMRTLIAVIVALLLARGAAAQKAVSFPTEDGGVVYANVYGESDRGIVLAHGGRFKKESQEKHAQTLASAGFRVLALDFRGYGKSRGPGDSAPMSAPLHLDVLAAVRYLRKTGAKSVSVVGGSMGGGAAGDASIASQRGEIDRVVFLGAYPNGPAEKLKCASLCIVARDDANEDGP